jgi:hypothetical protein
MASPPFTRYCVADFYIPGRAFIGLGVAEKAPAHSTLTVLRLRLIETDGAGALAKNFDMIIARARVAGVVFGKVLIMDTVYPVANVNPEGERQRGEGPAAS